MYFWNVYGLAKTLQSIFLWTLFFGIITVNDTQFGDLSFLKRVALFPNPEFILGHRANLIYRSCSGMFLGLWLVIYNMQSVEKIVQTFVRNIKHLFFPCWSVNSFRTRWMGFRSNTCWGFTKRKHQKEKQFSCLRHSVTQWQWSSYWAINKSISSLCPSARPPSFSRRIPGGYYWLAKPLSPVRGPL